MDNEFPAWYQSSAGPKVSATIIGLVGNVVPMLNLLLASRGINIMPAGINEIVSTIVFVVFSVKALMGYIRAKQVLGSRILKLGGTLPSSEV